MLNQVYDCDETGLFWKALPSKTLASSKESKAPGCKVSKERVTNLACVNATGEHKLRLTIVSKPTCTEECVLQCATSEIHQPDQCLDEYEIA